MCSVDKNCHLHVVGRRVDVLLSSAYSFLIASKDCTADARSSARAIWRVNPERVVYAAKQKGAPGRTHYYG